VASKMGLNHEDFHDPSSLPLLFHQEDDCCNIDCGLEAFPGPLTVITPRGIGAQRDCDCSSYPTECGSADYYCYYYYLCLRNYYDDGVAGVVVQQNALPYEVRTLHDTLPSSQVSFHLNTMWAKRRKYDENTNRKRYFPVSGTTVLSKKQKLAFWVSPQLLRMFLTTVYI